MNPFDYVKAINYTKKNILVDPKDYEACAFVVNHTLSYFPDTVAYSNIMNRYNNLPGRLQFDFLINTIRKRKRFSKWEKPSTSESLDVIKEYYGYSTDKAKQVLILFSDDVINKLKMELYKGGITRK
jgi:hypothetical protein